VLLSCNLLPNLGGKLGWKQDHIHGPLEGFLLFEISVITAFYVQGDIFKRKVIYVFTRGVNLIDLICLSEYAHVGTFGRPCQK